MVSRTDGGSLFPSKEFDAELSSRILAAEYETWFHGARFSYEAPNVVRIVVPGRFQCMWIERHFAQALAEAVQAAFSIDATLHFECGDGASGSHPVVETETSRQLDITDLDIAASTETSAGNPSVDVGAVELGSPTRPDLSFDRFVVGSSNRMAHAATLSVTERPGHPYNPLVIYGSSGLGKSHLLQACHQKLRSDGGHRTLYLTGEAFVNLCKVHVGNDSASLRERLREYDVIAIDGLQWIALDESFQEVLALVVQDACEDGRQLVVSVDRAPWELPGLTARLASRLKTGLVTGIDPLTFDLKVELLQKKAALQGLKLSDEIAETLARGVGENPCFVEGLIKQLVGMVQSQEGTVPRKPTPSRAHGDGVQTAENAGAPSGAGAQNAPHVLDGMPALSLLLQAETPARRLEICDIHKAVANYYSLRRADILSSSRKNSLVLARQVAMYLCRHLTQHSFGEIGSYFGGRDHATVIYAVKKITRLTHEDAQVGQDLERISQSLGTIS